ncbi:MAG: radical SAM protein [bacterium]
MAKIVLVEPRAPGLHVYSAFTFPRLGLPLIGAILKGRGHDVEIYVQQWENVPLSALRGADVVGVSVTTSTASEGYKIARFARRAGIPVMMGGPHVTFLPDEALRYCDVVVRGEGEAAAPPVIEALLGNGSLGTIRGVSYMEDGAPVHTPDAPPVRDLDSLPFPDLTLVRGHRRMRLVPVQTSRGCPHRCTFCSVTQMFGHRYRFRSEGNVVEELMGYPHRRIFFCDDNFAASPVRTMRLLKLMRDRHVPVASWSAQVRVDVARNDDLLKLMRQTRCRRLYIGFESVNPKTLERFNKKQNVEDIERCVERLHEHHIKVHGMFVLGSDDDDVDTVRQTLAFARRMSVDTAQFLVLTPIPGTQTTRELESEGRIFTRNWTLYDGHHVVYQPVKMSPYQLQLSVQNAMLEFYSYSHALRYFLRWDAINGAFRLIGHSLVRKGIRYSRDFVAGLKHHEFKLAMSAGGFVFDENSMRERLIEFRNRSADRLRAGMDRLRLTVTSINEMRSRASFIRLRGDMDRPHARRLLASLRASMRRGKNTLVINFENVSEITPSAFRYLAVKFARIGLKKQRSLKLLGLPEDKKAELESMTRRIPCFEVFESEESLEENLLVS